MAAVNSSQSQAGYHRQLFEEVPEVAKLTRVYLRVVLLGASGYAAFEAGKDTCEHTVYLAGAYSP